MSQQQIESIHEFSQSPFPVTPELLAIAIAYRNERLIADRVMPFVPVGKTEFRWLKIPTSQHFTVPHSKVGPKGDVNEVESRAESQPGAVDDHGLKQRIPQRDMDNSDPNYDPEGRATQRLTDLILLAHEVTVSGIVFNADTYPSSLRKTLSGSSQWSHADSDPVKEILEALDEPLVRPNVMTIGQEAWTVLRQNPKIVKATNRNSGDAGAAARQAVAELFELDEILVGQGRVNTSKNPETVSLQRTWGKHCALTYRDENADTTGGLTFGYTARWGEWKAGSRPGDFGLHGGVEVLVGHSVKPLVVASSAGYFLQNVTA